MDIQMFVRQKRVIIPAVLVILYTVAGFFILPAMSKKIITEKLSSALNRPVTIEKIRVNPYSLTFEVIGFAVKEKDASEFIAADRLFANASILSLFTFSGVLSQFQIDNPAVKIVRNKNGTFNFTDLLEQGGQKQAEAGQSDQGSKIPSFTIENFGLTGGKIMLDDQPTKVFHEIKDLSFSIPIISSKPRNKEKQVQSSVDLSANGSEFKIKASGTPFNEGMASEFEIMTGNIDLRHYLSYIPLPEGLELAAIDINLDAKLSFKKTGKKLELGLDTKINVLNTRILDEHKKGLVSLPKIFAHVKSQDIFSRVIHVPSITVASPQIEVKRDEQANLNLLRYIPQKDEPPENPAVQSDSLQNNEKRVVLTLDRFGITDARINFEDLSEDKLFRTVLSPLNFNLTGFKLTETVLGEFDLEFTTASQEKVATRGRFDLLPLNIDGTVSVSDLKIENFSPYFEKFIHVDLAGAGVNLDSDFKIFKKDDALDAQVTAKKLLLTDIDIKDRKTKQSIVSMPELKVTGAGFHFLDRKITSGRIETRMGQIQVIRDKDGIINLVPPIKAADKKEADQAVAEPGKEESSNPWDITLEEFDLEGYSIGFDDNVPVDAVHLSFSDISVNAAQLHTTGEKAGDVSAEMKFNDNGRISLKGKAIPKNLSADLEVVLDKLDIKSVQPYFAEAVKIMVTQGNMNTKGRIKLDLAQDAKSMLSFAGEASVSDFVSLDRKSAKDFFKCNSFYLAGVNVSLFPVNLSVRDVSLTDFYSLIRVDEKGSLNLSDIFTTRDAPEDEMIEGVESEPQQATDGAQPPQIKVASVTLQGGHLDFSDFMATPNFHATMKDIAGSVKGLSSDQDTKAILHLKGLHGNSSPLDITGFINPLAARKYVDIGLTFKDIELSRFTPYAAKYLGYKIEKGKLVLDLKYLIDGNALTSENKVRFDNFTLGESIKSEHATSLPVGLAISLLKDSNDQINLDLPVKGQLDDPEFKVGSIVLKMVANLILKVVTSPFSIIGAMFGGGEDLGYAEFAFGDSKLDGSDTIKLDTLAKILLEKPGINLEIQGSFNPEKDAQSLKQIAWTDLLKTLKFKQLVEQGSDITKTADVKIDEEEMPLLIETAYEEAAFPKPRDEQGIEKELDIEEKKKLLITNIDISEDDLRQLAMRRSEAIKEYLVTNSAVEKERIFLLEPKAGDVGDETLSQARVIFLLK